MKDKIKKLLTFGLVSVTILWSLKDRVYNKVDNILQEASQKMAYSEIFNKIPTRCELGTPIYSARELGDLVNKEIPTTITFNSVDGEGHWSNDPRYVKSITERLKGRFKPTHTIYFSPINEGEYRFNIK